MSVILYRSSDVGAPILNGTVGSLINIYDGCLVNGYGVKSAAGWTKSFSGTNTASYRQGSGSNQYYFHVNDNGPGTDGAKEARIFGSEQATAILTGTSLFPTTAQHASGMFVRKSSAFDSSARGWVMIADARTFYLFILTGDVNGVYSSSMFGEFFSYKLNDPGRTIIIARFVEASSAMAYNYESFDGLMTSFVSCNGHFKTRDSHNNFGSYVFGKIGSMGLVTPSSPNPMSGLVSGYSNIGENRILLAPIQLTMTVATNCVPGCLRGIWHFCHSALVPTDRDIFYGINELGGKTFMILKTLANNGVACIEISDTWDTN